MEEHVHDALGALDEAKVLLEHGHNAQLEALVLPQHERHAVAAQALRELVAHEVEAALQHVLPLTLSRFS